MSGANGAPQPGPYLLPDHLAEKAGHAIGHQLLNAMLGAKSDQARCLSLLSDALKDAADHPASLCGLAASLVNVLQLGLSHLPRACSGEEE